jgi:hypothetical protein
MKRGKAPTPTAILKARGSWRGDIRTGEPLPDLQPTDCPPELKTDFEKQLWYRLHGRMINQKIYDSSNEGPLVRYVQLRGLWNGVMDGELDNISNITKLSASLGRLEAVFGLTPADRTRVRSEQEEEKDDNKMRFFGKKA